MLCGHKKSLDTLALEYLKKRKPENKILNIREENIVLIWTEPNYELDGLIYDQTENTFYVIVRENFSDDDIKRLKIEATLEEFRKFITYDKPICKKGSGRGSCLTCRRKIRMWLEFFDPECGCIIRENDKNDTKLFVLNCSNAFPDI